MTVDYRRRGSSPPFPPLVIHRVTAHDQPPSGLPGSGGSLRLGEPLP
jgi:hypothetical protein